MTSARAWAVTGVLAGVAGVAASYLAAALLLAPDAPFIAVVELLARLVPGPLADLAIRVLGSADKPILVTLVAMVMFSAFAIAGLAWRRSWWRSLVIWVLLGLVGLLGVVSSAEARLWHALSVLVGVLVAVVAMGLGDRGLRSTQGVGVPGGPSSEDAAQQQENDGPGAATRPGADDVPRPDRRRFLAVTGGISVTAVSLAFFGALAQSARHRVEASRRLLLIPGATRRRPPASTRIGVPGITPWRTEPGDFYVIDTTFTVPVIDPAQWRLRVHGLVERPLELSIDALTARELTEAWVTLCCVSNPVGGDLIGNAWWSGVRVADLLAEAGVQAGADAVLQTSEDGWTCLTPLAALTDERDALVALAMNGRPLPLEHGFPARLVVPGLYGYVSACKWVVDLEVTRFDKAQGYWTDKGWSALGPVKIASRIDVPRNGDTVPVGEVAVGGVAWFQHTGIARVEVALDGADWVAAELARTPNVDTWVQWGARLNVGVGPHQVAVRAIGKDGSVQTGVRRDPDPDGATGWHRVEFTAEET